MNAVSLSEVLARPDLWRGGYLADAALPTVSSGFAELDAELPGAGWPRGGLTEVLCDACGQGELSLLLPGLRQLCADDGWLLLIAPPYALQAPAWASAGIPLRRLLVVLPHERSARTPREVDALWAAQQALISAAPAAIVCWSATQDARAVHRLQVAALTSHSASFLFRPWRAAGSASAAPLRLGVASGEQGRLDVQILKRRGPPLAAPLKLALPRPAFWQPHASLVARPPLSLAAARRAAAPASALHG
jgi:cell division inhibitor SulA